MNYAITNPATGETVANYTTISNEELHKSINSAANAFQTWKQTTTVANRVKILKRVSELHTERRETLATAIVLEMGKPLTQALGEVDFSADIYAYYAENAESFLADESIELRAGSGSAFVRRTPLGVLLGIMPWNFPAYQVARFAAPNLAAGNTILLKHSEQCPKSSALIEAIFQDAGFPSGTYTNIYATHAQIETIIADPRVQGVSLTGSERAGAAVAEIAGRNLKKVVLELGGSDPFILLNTSNMSRAVEAAVNARLDNNGQSCNGAKRFIIIDSLYEEFLESFTKSFTAVEATDPLVADTVLGPLSSQKATATLADQVKRAVAQGATLVAGGTPTGNYFPPTVLTNVSPNNDAYTEEFFGPVAVIYSVANEDEAVSLANDTPFGLGSYIWCDDTEKATRVADRLDAGMVFINLVLADGSELPFGGVKRSGSGRELGRFAIEEFVNKKLIRAA